MLANHNIIELILLLLPDRKDRNNLSICNKRIYTVAKRLRLNNKCDCDYFQYNAIKHVRKSKYIVEFEHELCGHGTVKQVKLLIKMGLKINLNHIYCAGYTGNKSVLKYLLDVIIIDKNDTTDYGLDWSSVLHYTYFDCFKLLCEFSIKNRYEHIISIYNGHSFYAATTYGIEAVKYMINLPDKYPHLKPLDIHFYSNEEWGYSYPPASAILNNDFETLKFLFNLSIERCQPYNIYSNACILSSAFNSGNAEIIKYILEISIDFNSPHNPEGRCIDFNENYMNLCRSQFVKENTITHDNIDIAVADIVKHGFDIFAFDG